MEAEFWTEIVPKEKWGRGMGRPTSKRQRKIAYFDLVRLALRSILLCRRPLSRLRTEKKSQAER
jgi:hypothetical protein